MFGGRRYAAFVIYARLLAAMGKSEAEIKDAIGALTGEGGESGKAPSIARRIGVRGRICRIRRILRCSGQLVELLPVQVIGAAGRARRVSLGRGVSRRRRVIGRRRGRAGRHALRIIGVVLLRRVSRRVLGIGDAGSATEDRTRGRADTGATATADRTTDRGSKPGAEKRAAKNLGIRLTLDRSNLLVGILPARLIVIIRLRHHGGAQRHQDRGGETRLDRPHQNSPQEPAILNCTAWTLTLGEAASIHKRGLRAFFMEARGDLACAASGDSFRLLASIGAMIEEFRFAADSRWTGFELSVPLFAKRGLSAVVGRTDKPNADH